MSVCNKTMAFALGFSLLGSPALAEDEIPELFEYYCFDCHPGAHAQCLV